MRNRKSLVCLFLVLMMVATVLAGCSQPAPSAAPPASKAPDAPPASQAAAPPASSAPAAPPAEKKLLRWSSTSPNFDSPPFAQASEDLFNAIETGVLSDRLRVEMYWGGSLGTSVEAMFGGLQNGSFEMVGANQTLFSEYTKAWMPLDIPYLITSVDQTKAVLTGDVEKVMNDKAVAESNIRIVIHAFMGYRHVTSSKAPITKLEDFKNLKIRLMSNPLQMAAFEALGASCTAVAYAELYTALQQKMVDAQENPISNDVDKKFYEVQKYFTYTYHLPALSCTQIAEQVFQTFDDQLKADFLDVCKKATLASFDYTTTADDEQAKILGEHMEMIELDPAELQRLKDAAATAADKYKEIIGAEYYDQVVPMIQALAQ